MITIISPAKKLQKANLNIKNFSDIEFPDEAGKLANELKKYKPEEISSLMKISPKLAELNYERYLKWEYPFKNPDAGIAIFMFNGDVYRGMSAKDFSKNEIQFAQNNLRILSGLYGLIKPLDKILPYRLEMGTKLKISNAKNLYEFWNNKITERLNKHLKEQNAEFLVNLASDEYFKAVKPENLKAKIIKPVFKEQKNDKYKVIAIHAKRARGLMCRYIIKNKIKNPEDLKGFNCENYYFKKELSTDTEYVFVR